MLQDLYVSKMERLRRNDCTNMNKILFAIILLNVFIVPVYAATTDVPSLQIATNVTPSTVAPGDNGYVQLSITNVGNIPADSVVIRLSSIDQPLVPVTTFNENGIGGLNIGKTVSTVFVFNVPSSTTKGFYRIEFGVESCANSVCRDASQYVIVDVESTATNFDISFQETSDNTTSLSISNVGINPAIAVSVSIPPQENFSTPQASEVFLGNLNSGDFTVADFQLVPKKNMTEGILKVDITYTDSNNNRITLEKSVLVKLQPVQTITTRRSGNEILYIAIAAVAIVVIIAFFLWKRKKK